MILYPFLSRLRIVLDCFPTAVVFGAPAQGGGADGITGFHIREQIRSSIIIS